MKISRIFSNTWKKKNLRQHKGEFLWVHIWSNMWSLPKKAKSMLGAQKYSFKYTSFRGQVNLTRLTLYWEKWRFFQVFVQIHEEFKHMYFVKCMRHFLAWNKSGAFLLDSKNANFFRIFLESKKMKKKLDFFFFFGFQKIILGKLKISSHVYFQIYPWNCMYLRKFCMNTHTHKI